MNTRNIVNYNSFLKQFTSSPFTLHYQLPYQVRKIDIIEMLKQENTYFNSFYVYILYKIYIQTQANELTILKDDFLYQVTDFIFNDDTSTSFLFTVLPKLPSENVPTYSYYSRRKIVENVIEGLCQKSSPELKLNNIDTNGEADVLEEALDLANPDEFNEILQNQQEILINENAIYVQGLKIFIEPNNNNGAFEAGFVTNDIILNDIMVSEMAFKSIFIDSFLKKKCKLKNYRNFLSGLFKFLNEADLDSYFCESSDKDETFNEKMDFLVISCVTVYYYCLQLVLDGEVSVYTQASSIIKEDSNIKQKDSSFQNEVPFVNQENNVVVNDSIFYTEASDDRHLNVSVDSTYHTINSSFNESNVAINPASESKKFMCYVDERKNDNHKIEISKEDFVFALNYYNMLNVFIEETQDATTDPFLLFKLTLSIVMMTVNNINKDYCPDIIQKIVLKKDFWIDESQMFELHLHLIALLDVLKNVKLSKFHLELLISHSAITTYKDSYRSLIIEALFDSETLTDKEKRVICKKCFSRCKNAIEELTKEQTRMQSFSMNERFGGKNDKNKMKNERNAKEVSESVTSGEETMNMRVDIAYVILEYASYFTDSLHFFEVLNFYIDLITLPKTFQYFCDFLCRNYYKVPVYTLLPSNDSDFLINFYTVFFRKIQQNLEHNKSRTLKRFIKKKFLIGRDVSNSIANEKTKGIESEIIEEFLEKKTCDDIHYSLLLDMNMLGLYNRKRNYEKEAGKIETLNERFTNKELCDEILKYKDRINDEIKKHKEQIYDYESIVERHIIQFCKYFLEKREEPLSNILNMVPFLPAKKDYFNIYYEIWNHIIDKYNVDCYLFFALKTPALNNYISELPKDQPISVHAFNQLNLTLKESTELSLGKKLSKEDFKNLKNKIEGSKLKKFFNNPFFVIIYHIERFKVSNYNFTGVIEYISDINILSDHFESLSFIIPLINLSINDHILYLQKYALVILSNFHDAYGKTQLLMIEILLHIYQNNDKVSFSLEIHRLFNENITILSNVVVKKVIYDRLVYVYTKEYLQGLKQNSAYLYNYVLFNYVPIQLFQFDHNLLGTVDAIFTETNLAYEKILKFIEFCDKKHTEINKKKNLAQGYLHISKDIPIYTTKDVKILEKISKAEKIDKKRLNPKEIEIQTPSEEDVSPRSQRLAEVLKKSVKYLTIEEIEEYELLWLSKPEDLTYLIDVIIMKPDDRMVIKQCLQIILDRLHDHFNYKDLYIILKINNILEIKNMYYSTCMKLAIKRSINFNSDEISLKKISEESHGFYKFFFQNLYYVITGNPIDKKYHDFPKISEIKEGFTPTEVVYIHNIFKHSTTTNYLKDMTSQFFYINNHFINFNELSIPDIITLIMNCGEKRILQKTIDGLRNRNVLFFIPQLVQCLAIKELFTDIFLVLFELCQNEYICHNLLWNLKANTNLSPTIIQKCITDIENLIRDKQKRKRKSNTIQKSPPITTNKDSPNEIDNKIGNLSIQTDIKVESTPLDILKIDLEGVLKPEFDEASLVLRTECKTVNILIDKLKNYIIENHTKNLEFVNEIDFFNQLTNVSALVMPHIAKSKNEKAMLFNNYLSQIKVNGNIYLPIDINFLIVGIVANSARALQSAAKAPYMASFYCIDRRKIAEYLSDNKILFEYLEFLDNIAKTKENKSGTPSPQCEKSIQEQDNSSSTDVNQMIKIETLERILRNIEIIDQFPFYEFTREKALWNNQEDKKEIYKCFNTKLLIFKAGDDCRQDMFALQIIQMFKNVFDTSNLDIFLFPYQVIATERDSGIIEVVPNAVTRDQIGKEKINNLVDYFNVRYGYVEGIEYQNATYNFCRSLAGYSLASYFLNIKDRHNANIMINSEGYVIHIDFGFIFEISPGNLNIEIPIKITREICDLLFNTHLYAKYVDLMQKGFLAIRRNSKDIIMMADCHKNSGLPCYKKNAVQNFIKRFRFDLNDEKAKKYIEEMIQNSLKGLRTWAYDKYQELTNNIKF